VSEPVKKSDLSYEHGQRYAEAFLTKVLSEDYPNNEYETAQAAIREYRFAASQALEQAGDVIRDDPKYLENYCEDLRGFLSRFDWHGDLDT
jgi:hypothetical protein